MSKSAREAVAEALFVRWAEQQGYYCLKLRIDGQNGFPDRTLLTPFGVMFIEFKTPSGRLSFTQKRWRLALEKLGFRVAVARSMEEAVAAFTEWKNDVGT